MSSQKAQAHTISVVIIASISIVLITMLFNYAIYSLESTVQQAEFENAKNSMKMLAEETINTIQSGVGAEIRFSSRTIRLNFIRLNKNLVLKISASPFLDIPNEITVDSDILIVACYGGEYASYENQVIYGDNDNPAFVSDIFSTPIVQTMWDISVGRVGAVLNFTRLLMKEYRIPSGSSDEVIIELAYIDACWEAESATGSGTIEVLYRDTNEQTIYDGYIINPITITFALYLDDEQLGTETQIIVEGSCFLKIKLVKHVVLYKVR